MTSRIQKKLTLYGQVQGVFFRQTAKQQADQRNLTGHIRNNPDGSVTLQVEGDSTGINEFIDWCKLGPKDAQVEKIEIEDSSPTNETGFSVRL